MPFQEMHEHIYTYASATYCYAVTGCMPANREDALVLCLVSVCTTCYSSAHTKY